MSKSIVVIVGVVLLVALLLFSMTYTVNFHEVAIKTRFGKTTSESIITDAGLKFRLPLIADKVTTFDTRLQLRETSLEQIQTADKQVVLARAFLLWKVDVAGNGPLNFYNSYPGGIEEANQSITGQFVTALTAGLSRFRFDDMIGPNSKLESAEQAIMAELAASLKSKGIEPKTVGISQLLLPAKTTTAVLTRMEAERTNLSETERSRGDALATDIQTRASTQADKIKAFAEQRATEIRAQGDKDAANINAALAKEGGEDLAVFELWLDTLRTTLQQQTTVVLPWTYAPFHLLNFNNTNKDGSIPAPQQDMSPIGGAANPPREVPKTNTGNSTPPQTPGGS